MEYSIMSSFFKGGMAITTKFISFFTQNNQGKLPHLFMRFFIFLIVIVLLTGCTHKNANQPKEDTVTTIQNNTATSTIDTSDWQTYENKEYWFSFRYPKDMSFEVVDDDSSGNVDNGEFAVDLTKGDPQNNSSVYFAFDRLDKDKWKKYMMQQGITSDDRGYYDFDTEYKDYLQKISAEDSGNIIDCHNWTKKEINGRVYLVEVSCDLLNGGYNLKYKLFEDATVYTFFYSLPLWRITSNTLTLEGVTGMLNPILDPSIKQQVGVFETIISTFSTAVN